MRIESYTGAVNNPLAVLLWSAGAIWANTGNKAVLYDASSKTIDSACYESEYPRVDKRRGGSIILASSVQSITT